MDQNKFEGYLSNFEVMKTLKEIKEKDASLKQERLHRLKRVSTNTHMSTVVYETLQYFQNTPCAVQDEDCIKKFVKKMEPYKLTKPENLNILNTRPSKAIDLQAIIEESEERLSEAQMNEILEIIEETLPALSVKNEVELTLASDAAGIDLD